MPPPPTPLNETLILSLSNYYIDKVMVDIEDLYYIIFLQASLSNKLFTSFHYNIIYTVYFRIRVQYDRALLFVDSVKIYEKSKLLHFNDFVLFCWTEKT